MVLRVLTMNSNAIWRSLLHIEGVAGALAFVAGERRHVVYEGVDLGGNQRPVFMKLIQKVTLPGLGQDTGETAIRSTYHGCWSV